MADARIALIGLAGFKQVADLHLVNLAAQHAARLVTFDTKLRPILGPDDSDRVHVLG